MDNTTDKQIKGLQQENEKLKQELDEIRASRKRNLKKMFKTGYQTVKKVLLFFFIGSRVKNSTRKLVKEVNSGNVHDSTLADFGSSIILRLTRIGIVAFIALAIPHLLFWQQNQLIKLQNKKIDVQTELFKQQNTYINQQSHLAEAARRSSQSILLGEVLREIDQELKAPGNTKDTLSGTLVSRLISLSIGLKPYRYLENEKLIPKALSPERGQLLTSLLYHKIDSTFFARRILGYVDFSAADLRGVIISNADLSNANLEGADFSGAILSSVRFNNTNLSQTNFINTQLTDCRIEGAYFVKANLDGAILGFGTLENTAFDNTAIVNTDFFGTRFEGVHFKQTILNNVSFIKTDFIKNDFQIFDDNDTYFLNSNVNIFDASAYMDSIIVDREDWVRHMKDSLWIRGLESITSIDTLSEKRQGFYWNLFGKKQSYYLLERQDKWSTDSLKIQIKEQIKNRN